MQNTTQYKIKNRKKRTAAETGFQVIENTSIICHAVPIHQSRKAVKTYHYLPVYITVAVPKI